MFTETSMQRRVGQGLAVNEVAKGLLYSSVSFGTNKRHAGAKVRNSCLGGESQCHGEMVWVVCAADRWGGLAVTSRPEKRHFRVTTNLSLYSDCNNFECYR